MFAFEFVMDMLSSVVLRLLVGGLVLASLTFGAGWYLGDRYDVPSVTVQVGP